MICGDYVIIDVKVRLVISVYMMIYVHGKLKVDKKKAVTMSRKVKTNSTETTREA